MKRELFFLTQLLLATICTWASPTAQLLWCSDNTTMYFIYTEKVYTPGETWDGQTITNVWSGDDVLHQQYQTTWHLTVGYVATTAVIDRSFQYARPTSLVEWFYDCQALTTIKGLEYLNTSEVTNTKFMFSGAWLLTELDLTGFDMSKVEDATHMFFGCDNLTTIYCNDTWNIPVTGDMFFYDEKLTSPAASYDRSHADGSMANPDTGYFTRCKLTPQAFYCSGDKTLYFTNTKIPYKVGDQYNGQTIDLMWRNDSVLNARYANDSQYNFLIYGIFHFPFARIITFSSIFNIILDVSNWLPRYSRTQIEYVSLLT